MVGHRNRVGSTRSTPPGTRAALGAVMLFAAGLGTACGRLGAAQQESAAAASAARLQRQSVAAQVALAPLPVGVPVIERPGADADGYPRSYVDRVALRSLLGRGKYAELNAFIAQFQRDFEADFHHEYFVSDAADAFESADEELGAQLDEWVKATPDSFPPYLARGTHLLSRGYAGRGTKWASETSANNFKAMADAFAPAFADFERVLQINPRVVAALRGELKVAFPGREPGRDPKSIAERAFKLCPACFQVRVVYQYALEPRWGGSYAAMAAAARAANLALNPRFKLLPGFADRDRAQSANSADDLEQALTLIEGACALGDDVDFLLQKGQILVRRRQEVLAIAAFSRALELRPQRPDVLFARADANLRRVPPNPQAAYEDLLLGLRLEATNSNARRTLPNVVGALLHAATDAEALKDPKGALRYLDEAFDLAPSNDLDGRRARVLTMGFQGNATELATLKQRADSAPHDFYAHQQLDYALSTFQRWDEIVAMWTAFIAQNPQEGHAYFERCGTYSHMPGMRSAAKADSVRACELGVSPACVLAKRL